MPMLESVPPSFIAGDTVRFTLTFGDYPAPTWDLVFYAENSGYQFSQASVDSGSSHAFTILATTTDDIPAGRYKWAIRATDGTVVETIDGGWLEVEIDPAFAGEKDHRSWARRTLDAVEAFLEGNATTAQQAISIAGRSISRWSLSELLQWRDRLRQEVRAEEQAEAAGLGRQVRVRVGRA
jgi:hypothetical protein